MRRYFLFFLITILSAFACSRFILRRDMPEGDSWPQYGGNAGHHRFSDSIITVPLKLLWNHRASSALGRGIFIHESAVFYGTLDGKVEGVLLENGKRIGLIKTRGNYAVTCGLSGRILIVQHRQSQPSLYAYDLNTGNKIWKTVCPNSFGEMLLQGERIYFTTSTGKVLCHTVGDGIRVWSADLENQSHSSPAYSDGYLYFGDDGGVMYCFDTDGKLAWKKYAGGALLADPVVAENTVFWGCTDSTFYAIDKTDGQNIWSKKFNGRIYNGAAVAKQLVIFGTTGHTVYAVYRDTGKVLWTFKAGSVISTAPAVAGNTVFIGSLDQKLYALDLKSGNKIWDYTATGRIRTDPVIVQDKVIFASENDKVYCFGPE
ncbi:PQQ-binding-like beta-propeller repeat protein [candidate division KSB1 bacterium]|nr:PQQ-binding-like beta-propeller repeat protein [candidate division KSB1 bacterium]